MGLFACHIPKTEHNIDLLHLIDHAGVVAFDHYSENEEAYFVELTQAEIDLLNHYGVAVIVDADIGALAAERKAERAAGLDDDISTGYIDHYVDAAEAAERIQALATEFPALCQHSTLPHMTEGYDGSNAALLGPSQVHILRITTTPAATSKPGLLLVCGTHAREWVNPMIAIEFAEQLLRNYAPGSADPDVIRINRIVEQGDVFIVPVMNPDGVNYSHYDDPGWRKNRVPNAGFPACPGVDNNRNYDIYFGGSGSSGSACSDTHRGSAAFSEYENQNIRYILETYPNILIGVDSHSRGEKIFRPTSTGGSYIASLPVAAEDEAIYADLEAAAVTAIAAVNGTTYLTGTTSNHAGTSDEYMFFAHRVFGFDFECAQSFQPPIADALISIQEITAALLVLAEKAVDLEVMPATHSSIVQCIDRTGSMITFGYEAGARANARRFIDLMSIGDSAAIVSFADPSSDPSATPPDERAVVEFPLTEIDTPLVYSDLRDSIDAIAFGGWTSIGAGLQQSMTQLSAASAPKAIVLISDGFENRTPSVASVLTTIPADIRVYTIALGTTADTALLEDIATTTGGLFYQSPGGLELHEIYNQIRADVSDDDLVINEELDSDDDGCAECRFHIEPNVHVLNLSYSWEAAGYHPRVRLFSPAGREMTMADLGVTIKEADSYCIVSIRRPAAGQWRASVENAPARAVLATFVSAPLKNRTVAAFEIADNKFKVTLLAQLRHGHIRWSEPKGSALLTQVRQLSAQTRNIEKTLHHGMLDAMPLPGVFDQARLAVKCPPTVPHYAPLQSWRPPAQAVPGTARVKAQPVASSSAKAQPWLTGATRHYAAATYTNLDRNGIYNARLRIHGNFGGGFQYQRSALRTVTALTRPCHKPDKGWLIVGSVSDDNGKPVTDVVVEARDKDLFFNDYLGTSHVDTSGKFEICYGTDAFADIIFDKRPDIYLQVFNKEGELLLTSPVRHNASPYEKFNLHVCMLGP
ncbi:MAG: VWA domain-containing protein [Thiohalocapsa sp. PB-PSB1]|jgi:murein tripeptide amidase MpaA|nr:MAG: VWA domain-containing protein [Thiohalocapsa sp. PB-PSB1]